MPALKTPPVEQDHLLTLREVSSQLRVSYRTVLRFCKDGRLNSVRVGKRRLVRGADLERALKVGISLD